MSVTYPAVITHPALSPAARDDDVSGRFEAQQEIAEMLLGLAGVVFTRPLDVQQAEHAIALQVSFQYAQGMDAHVYSSLSSERMESRSYRGDARGATVVHAVAARLAESLLASRTSPAELWSSGIRSMRGPGC